MNNTTTNETVLVLGEGTPPIHVEQGPTWLVELYLAPPPWLNPLLQALAALVVAVVAYRLYQRDFRIDLETQHEMQLIVAYIAMIASSTLAMVNLTSQPYPVDVSVGFLVGYGAVYLPQTRLVPFEWPAALQDPGDRTALIWLLLALAAYTLPMVVAVDGQGMQLGTSRLALAGLSMAMVFYNIALTEVTTDV